MAQILVVEDDEKLNALLTEFLSDEGHQITTATSLADLITPNGGTYDWAACRNYPLLP